MILVFELGLLYKKFIVGIFALEIVQLISRSVFDSDNLLLNTLRFIIGYNIYIIGGKK